MDPHWSECALRSTAGLSHAVWIFLFAVIGMGTPSRAQDAEDKELNDAAEAEDGRETPDGLPAIGAACARRFANEASSSA